MLLFDWTLELKLLGIYDLDFYLRLSSAILKIASEFIMAEGGPILISSTYFFAKGGFGIAD